MFTPVITEKSLKDAKEGCYTFRFPVRFSKYQAKEVIESTFGVHVKNIRTIRIKGRKETTIFRRKRTTRPSKKVIVTLADKEKIDLFEAKK